MEKILTTILSAFVALPSLANVEGFHPITLHGPPIEMAVDAASVDVRVDYPGLGADAVCSLELKLSQFAFATPEMLNEVLKVEEIYDHHLVPIEFEDSKTGIINLERGRFVTAFTVSSRDGRKLRDVLAEIGVFNGLSDLILYGRGCAPSYR